MYDGWWLIPCAYLYGSIPFVWLIARSKGVNLRQRGGGNIGTTNLIKTTGFWVGLGGAFFDFTKGLLPILVGYYILHLSLVTVCLAGLAGVAGQCWPLFLKFSGGRGGTPSMAMALTLVPWEALIALIPFMLSGIRYRIAPFRGRSRLGAEGGGSAERGQTHIVPLAMLVSFALLPLITALWQQPLTVTLGTVGLFLLLVVRRLTVGIREELAGLPRGVAILPIFINRFLYDRSH